MKLYYIVSYLEQKGWSEGVQRANYTSYRPPEDLFIPADFVIELPNRDDRRGFEEYVWGVIDILVMIYDRSVKRDFIRHCTNLKSEEQAAAASGNQLSF